MVPRDSFWVNLFQTHFLDVVDDSDNKDDMLFYVRKSVSKSKLNIPQVCYSVLEFTMIKLHSIFKGLIVELSIVYNTVVIF